MEYIVYISKFWLFCKKWNLEQCIWNVHCVNWPQCRTFQIWCSKVS